MAVYKISAINLKVSNFGEADKLVAVFSREKGKVRILAKGARKPGSKLSGRTELFVHSRMLLAAGRNFEILTDSQILESFQALRSNLKKLDRALYFVWLVEQISPWNQANEKVFELLEKGLTSLLKTENEAAVSRPAFESELAGLEGVAPPPAWAGRSLKRYFEEYLERIYPSYFNELQKVTR